MGSKIEWLHYLDGYTPETWNPITGCTPVSEGCANCYAKRMANRLRGRCGYPADDPFRVTFHPDRLDQPSKWRTPRMVFVCSMGDLFHEDVPREWKDKIYRVITTCPQHLFLLLTKRPQYIMAYWMGRQANTWLGVTAENQQAADERIPILLQIPAAVRFVSVEQMLGPVDVSSWLCDHASCEDWGLCGGKRRDECGGSRGLDWIICGGETGPGARPMHPDWARSLRDQAIAAGVPFFFKQWGEWVPDVIYAVNQEVQRWKNDEGAGMCLTEAPGFRDIHEWHDSALSLSFRVGKKRAGRLLDGREWNEVPEVTA